MDLKAVRIKFKPQLGHSVLSILTHFSRSITLIILQTNVTAVLIT